MSRPGSPQSSGASRRASSRLEYRWRLREVMAGRGMFSTTDLRPLLAERGIDLSPSQIYRLVVEKPERLSLTTLMALIDVLDCQIGDLIEPGSGSRAQAAGSRARPPKPSAAGSQTDQTQAGVGEFRPRRARVGKEPPA